MPVVASVSPRTRFLRFLHLRRTKEHHRPCHHSKYKPCLIKSRAKLRYFVNNCIPFAQVPYTRVTRPLFYYKGLAIPRAIRETTTVEEGWLQKRGITKCVVVFYCSLVYYPLRYVVRKNHVRRESRDVGREARDKN